MADDTGTDDTGVDDDDDDSEVEAAPVEKKTRKRRYTGAILVVVESQHDFSTTRLENTDYERVGLENELETHPLFTKTVEAERYIRDLPLMTDEYRYVVIRRLGSYGPVMKTVKSVERLD